MQLYAPATLAHWTAGHWTAAPARALTGFSHDTRVLRPGEVFVALRTAKRDGHDFLAAAQAAGADAAIVASPNPTCPLPQLVVADPLSALQKIATENRRAFQDSGGIVIGITGSCGKTSTKELLALFLSEAFGATRVHATEGNLNNHIGVPLTLARLEPAMHTHAVIEAGISAPGEMEILAGMIAPDHAIITTIAPAHTETLGDLKTIAREKTILFQHVPRNGARLAPQNSSATGCQPMCLKRPPLPPFPSRGMSQNAALAIALATRLGVSTSQIHSALAKWRPAKWRGEIIHDPAGRLFYLDLYNANPASMADALDAFARIAPPALPRLYILGCMEELGADSPRYHRELGRTLSLHLRPRDEAILIGDQAPAIAAGATASATANAPLPPAPALPHSAIRPPQSTITTAATTAEITARVAAFQGSIFLKGSRRHALENTLPSDLAKSVRSV